jgi:hypothetical protein
VLEVAKLPAPLKDRPGGGTAENDTDKTTIGFIIVLILCEAALILLDKASSSTGLYLFNRPLQQPSSRVE